MTTYGVPARSALVIACCLFAVGCGQDDTSAAVGDSSTTQANHVEQPDCDGGSFANTAVDAQSFDEDTPEEALDAFLASNVVSGLPRDGFDAVGNANDETAQFATQNGRVVVTARSEGGEWAVVAVDRCA